MPPLLLPRLSWDDQDLASNNFSGTKSVSLKTVLFLGGATVAVFVLLMLSM